MPGHFAHRTLEGLPAAKACILAMQTLRWTGNGPPCVGALGMSNLLLIKHALWLFERQTCQELPERVLLRFGRHT